MGDTTVAEIRECGFAISHCAVDRYLWRFDNAATAAQYCRLMFGIDAVDDEILAGLEDTVGTRRLAGGFCFQWELLFIRAEWH